MYDTSYYMSSYSSNAAAAGIVGAPFIIYLIVVLVCSLGGYALTAFLVSRIFKKAGQKTSTAWIPIYNIWKFMELGDQKGWWIFVPGANMIFMYIAMYHIGKKLGKDDVFVALAIFVPVIWFIILGFDKSVWNGGVAAPAAAALAQPAVEAPVYTAPVAATEQPAYTAPVVTEPAPEAAAPVTPAYSEPVAPAQPEYSAPAPVEAPAADLAAAPEATAPSDTDIQ